MSQEQTHEGLGAALFDLSARANAALIRGEVENFAALMRDAQDFTLMQPFGGEPTRGFDPSREHLAQLARFFRGGTARLEWVSEYVSADMVVLAVIDRQRARIADLPEQDWSLRVTLMFRRAGAYWQLVHRHADPLVHGIALEQAAALARG